MKEKIIYHQILEAVRYLARNGSGSVPEILSNIQHDIFSGKYEEVILNSRYEFWNNTCYEDQLCENCKELK